MLGVIALGVLGAWGWEGRGADRSSQEQPGAAQERQESSGELWNAPGRAQGDPGHLETDTFGSEGLGAKFGEKPRLLSSEAPKILQIGSLTRKKHPSDLWSSCVA